MPRRLFTYAAIAATALCLTASACHHRDNRQEEQRAFAADTAALVLAVRQTSRLHAAEYRVHKLVTYTDERRLEASVLGHNIALPLTIGDRKVAMPITVTLRAYVDFSSFAATDIEVSASGDVLHVTLPQPEVVVTDSRVDHGATRQYVDLLRSRFTDAELAAFARQGEEAVMRSVADLGIIETARQSAAATLIPLFAQMGYDQSRIVVTFADRPAARRAASEPTENINLTPQRR